MKPHSPDEYLPVRDRWLILAVQPHHRVDTIHLRLEDARIGLFALPSNYKTLLLRDN